MGAAGVCVCVCVLWLSCLLLAQMQGNSKHTDTLTLCPARLQIEDALTRCELLFACVDQQKDLCAWYSNNYSNYNKIEIVVKTIHHTHTHIHISKESERVWHMCGALSLALHKKLAAKTLWANLFFSLQVFLS